MEWLDREIWKARRNLDAAYHFLPNRNGKRSEASYVLSIACDAGIDALSRLRFLPHRRALRTYKRDLETAARGYFSAMRQLDLFERESDRRFFEDGIGVRQYREAISRAEAEARIESRETDPAKIAKAIQARREGRPTRNLPDPSAHTMQRRAKRPSKVRRGKRDPMERADNRIDNPDEES